MKIVNRIKYLGLAFLLTAALQVCGQHAKIPPFSMLQANGKVFRAQQLPLGKPIVIIYFSPDCEHCDHMAQALLKNAESFKNASIAMITYLPVNAVQDFDGRFALASHQNIYTGTEGNTFFVRDYYKVTSIPFVALYTRDGDLVKEFRNDDAIADVMKLLKNL